MDDRLIEKVNESFRTQEGGVGIHPLLQSAVFIPVPDLGMGIQMRFLESVISGECSTNITFVSEEVMDLSGSKLTAYRANVPVLWGNLRQSQDNPCEWWTKISNFSRSGDYTFRLSRRTYSYEACRGDKIKWLEYANNLFGSEHNFFKLPDIATCPAHLGDSNIGIVVRGAPLGDYQRILVRVMCPNIPLNTRLNLLDETGRVVDSHYGPSDLEWSFPWAFPAGKYSFKFS